MDSLLGGPAHHSALRLDPEVLEDVAAAGEGCSRGRALDRAGDQCAGAGETELAKSDCGGAVEVCSQTHCPDLVAALCRKTLRLSPDVVHAQTTFAFLAIPQGDVAEIKRITSYVLSKRESRTEWYAIPRLRFMAHAWGDPHIERSSAERRSRW